MRLKVIFFISIFLSNFNLQAQQNFFRSNNSYAAPKEPINEIALTVVGGGGGGGADVGGGGGGGQVVNVSNYDITGVQSLTITVAGQTDYPAGYNHFGRNGANSSVSGGTGIITAMGGNGGRARSGGGPGSNIGWNGGGGSYDYNAAHAGQGGFAGGNAFSGRSCGGGGGSGGAGQAATITNPGNGGLGVLSIVDGKYYGGGGGGGEYGGTATGLGTHGGGDGGRSGSTNFGKDATPNTGGGGGGGPSTAENFNAGRGASGVVLIKYLGAPRATGGEISQSGGYTIHTFKSSGVFMVN